MFEKAVQPWDQNVCEKNQCKCGTCDGRCGPTNGCPCNECLQLLIDGRTVFMNRIGDISVRCSRKDGPTGPIILPTSEIWYCGNRKNQCKCGTCDGQCGPTNGCPCDDCFQLLLDSQAVMINRSGDAAIQGGRKGGTGGWTGLQSSQLRYCGKRKNQCLCGRCDGRCGPNNGCPCGDCLVLVGNPSVAVNRIGDPAVKGGRNGGPGGWTGLPPSQLWYCGRRKDQCRCGGCDGRCGPTNGCPCDDCAAILRPGPTIPPAQPAPPAAPPRPVLPPSVVPSPAGAPLYAGAMFHCS